MRSRFTRTKAIITTGAIALASGAALFASAGVATAASPSDVRADFHGGNVVNCAQAGFPGSNTAFANGASGINSNGIIGTTTGGKEANISTPLPAGIVIQAVVMKGGPAYNVYTATSGDGLANYTPLGVESANDDGLASPQHYISPLNGGGNVPTISHWFVCFTGGETPPPPDEEPGNLRLHKVVENPGNIQGLPTEYTVHVTCDDGSEDDVVLPANGDEVLFPVTKLNTFCVVLEDTLSGLPSGVTVTVTYDPANAEDNGSNDGVEVPGDGTDSDLVTVKNTFAQEPPTPAGETITPAAEAVQASPAFTG